MSLSMIIANDTSKTDSVRASHAACCIDELACPGVHGATHSDETSTMK